MRYHPHSTYHGVCLAYFSCWKLIVKSPNLQNSNYGGEIEENIAVLKKLERKKAEEHDDEQWKGKRKKGRQGPHWSR